MCGWRLKITLLPTNILCFYMCDSLFWDFREIIVYNTVCCNRIKQVTERESCLHNWSLEVHWGHNLFCNCIQSGWKREQHRITAFSRCCCFKKTGGRFAGKSIFFSKSFYRANTKQEIEFLQRCQQSTFNLFSNKKWEKYFLYK